MTDEEKPMSEAQWRKANPGVTNYISPRYRKYRKEWFKARRKAESEVQDEPAEAPPSPDLPEPAVPDNKEVENVNPIAMAGQLVSDVKAATEERIIPPAPEPEIVRKYEEYKATRVKCVAAEKEVLNLLVRQPPEIYRKVLMLFLEEKRGENFIDGIAEAYKNETALARSILNQAQTTKQAEEENEKANLKMLAEAGVVP